MKKKKKKKKKKKEEEEEWKEEEEEEEKEEEEKEEEKRRRRGRKKMKKKKKEKKEEDEKEEGGKEDYLVINPQGLGSSGLVTCARSTRQHSAHTLSTLGNGRVRGIANQWWLAFLLKCGSNVPVSHPDLARFLSKDIPS